MDQRLTTNLKWDRAETIYSEPPEGWFNFGTHVDQKIPLEFSKAIDEADGLPLYERPLLGSDKNPKAINSDE